MSDDTRYRLVVLGSGNVGKTCILHRFLHNNFITRYKETCEDMLSRDFHIGGRVLPLDMIDTNIGYPDMRRVAIVSANAFLIVFAVDDVASFKCASDLLNEICCRRSDAKDLPVVIVGNKCDISNKKINAETANAFVKTVVSSKINTVKYLETSAKTGENISQIFRDLLELSKFCEDDKSNTEQYISQKERNTHRRSSSFRQRKKSDKEKDATDSKPEKKTLTRHGSLMRRGFSMKSKPQAEVPDESNCVIS